MSSKWDYIAGSVIGSSHVKRGEKCQDRFAVTMSPDGDWISASVCDGASTSRNSAIAAEFFAQGFSKALMSVAEKLKLKPPGEWVGDMIISTIIDLRKQLREDVDSDDLSDYYCTLVACLIGPSGGFSVHIGDGYAYFSEAGSEVAACVNLSHNATMCLPENGEYGNETFFVTHQVWLRYFRMNPTGAAQFALLATDGAAAAILEHNKPKPDAIVPLMEQWAADRGNRDLVANVLNLVPNNVTDDDKTLVLICRDKLLQRGKFHLTKPPVAAVGASLMSGASPLKSVPTTVSSPHADNEHLSPQSTSGSAPRFPQVRPQTILLFVVLLLVMALFICQRHRDHPEKVIDSPNKQSSALTKSAAQPA